MIFLEYIVFCIIAYLIYWSIVSWLIGLPGMGVGILLVHLSSNGGGAFKKMLSILLGFLSYLLNFTLLAAVWGIAISFITFITMVDASHPLLYLFLGSVFAFSIVAPSGESNLLAAIQSLLVYLFYTAGQYIEIFEGGATAESYLHFFNYIYMISPIIFTAIVIIGAIISIRGILKLMEEGNLDKGASIFRRRNIKMRR